MSQLESWKDGAATSAVVDFVTRATTAGGSDFVAPADRIATFDNDGTLWVEQPMPPQFDFVFRKWGEEVKADPSLASQEPVQGADREGPEVPAGRDDPGPGGDRGAACRVQPVMGGDQS